MNEIIVDAYSHILSGQSYWQASLSSGRVVSELDAITDIRTATRRRTEWLEDIIASNDIQYIRSLSLCTPKGQANIECERPYAFFQINAGIASLLDGHKVKTAQIIGCLEDNNGACVCHIWDVLEQKLYSDFRTNVLDFQAWRNGLQPLGRLNIEALEVRL